MNLQPINAAASPEIQINENFETLDCFAVYGKRQPATSGLTWGYCGGRWGGFVVAAGTLTLTDSAENYVTVKKSDGSIAASTSATNWNDATNYTRAYKITAAGGAVATVEDHRVGPGGAFG